MASVRLRNSYQFYGKRIEYFYDGILVAEDAILEIPADHEPWIRRAWQLGYNKSPSGERLWTWQNVLDEIHKQNVAVPEKKKTTKRGKDDADEGANSGGQPATEHGLRTGEPAGSEGISE